MIIGLYLIITAWAVPGLPLWFSIVSTILGSLNILGKIVIISEDYT